MEEEMNSALIELSKTVLVELQQLGPGAYFRACAIMEGMLIAQREQATREDPLLGMNMTALVHRVANAGRQVGAFLMRR